MEINIIGSGSIGATDMSASTLIDKKILIDVPNGIVKHIKKLGYNTGEIESILITHLHGDHFFGLIGFLSTLSLQGRRGEMHIYAEPRLQELIGCQMKILHSRFTFPLFFHALSRREEVIYEDKVVTVTAFPLKHHYDTPVSGFLFREKERERTILKDRTAAWNVPIAFMQYLKRGEDFITPEGEIVANELLTVAPPPARSFAYMTDTLFRERFADYVRGVDLLYHEATYMNADAVLAKESYHSTTGQAARIAELAGVGKLLLGHFSARYTECSELLAEAREVFPNTFLCSDGDFFEVPAVKRRS